MHIIILPTTTLPLCMCTYYIYLSIILPTTTLPLCMSTYYIYLSIILPTTTLPLCMYTYYIYLSIILPTTTLPLCMYTYYIYLSIILPTTTLPLCMCTYYIYLSIILPAPFPSISLPPPSFLSLSYYSLSGITGAVDSREVASRSLPISTPVQGQGGEESPYPALPSFLSVVATVEATRLELSDRVLTERCAFR